MSEYVQDNLPIAFGQEQQEHRYPQTVVDFILGEIENGRFQGAVEHLGHYTMYRIEDSGATSNTTVSGVLKMEIATFDEIRRQTFAYSRGVNPTIADENERDSIGKLMMDTQGAHYSYLAVSNFFECCNTTRRARRAPR